MESALIITTTERNVTHFIEILSAVSINRITILPTCSEARHIILEQDFDLVIINAPLKDESGESLSRYIAADGLAQVILLVANEHFDTVSAICENDGVLVVSKPINRSVFWSVLKLAGSAQNKLKQVQIKNNKLKQEIEDIRIINRAKYLLITCLSMSEQEAHRYIEKQAMDMRVSKRTIAEGILKTYAN